MRKEYLVKKNPELPGTNNNWIRMNSYEFAMFMKTEEGKRRKDDFGRINAVDINDAIIYIECGKKDAAKIRKENDHADYLLEEEIKSGIITCSLNEKKTVEDKSDDEIWLIDESVDIEAEVFAKIERETLLLALGQLSEKELELVNLLYLCEKPVSEYKCAEILGLSRQGVHNRKMKILQTLRKLME